MHLLFITVTYDCVPASAINNTHISGNNKKGYYFEVGWCTSKYFIIKNLIFIGNISNEKTNNVLETQRTVITWCVLQTSFWILTKNLSVVISCYYKKLSILLFFFTLIFLWEICLFIGSLYLYCCLVLNLKNQHYKLDFLLEN